jgi:DNA end-binding protein Ku
MVARAVWKGFLKLGTVTCGVKLTGATSEAEKVHFRTLNRKSRLPVKARYVDEETGKPVEREDQVKGYELDNGDFVLIEPDEIKSLKVTSEHTLDIEGFVDKASVQSLYLEKPYYLYPADRASTEAFAVVREAMKRKKRVGTASIVLYQRERPVVIEPLGNGMIMTTLRNHNEVVAADTVFDDIGDRKVDPDMAEIASLIIEKKVTTFDPSKFEDRYENALIELINAKRAGKKLPKAAPAPKENVINLADVLRKSLEKEGVKAPAKKPAARAEPKRKSA